MKYRGRYKILQLDFPFKSEKWMWDGLFADEDKLKPMFNRNGLYYDRITKLCWIEINGEAFKYPRETFLYEFRIISHVPLSCKEVEAIEILMSRKNLCPKKIYYLYCIDRDWKQTRDTIRDTSLFMKKI